ncbi:hypothetical protein D3C84_1080400 [compost metagenome]
MLWAAFRSSVQSLSKWCSSEPNAVRVVYSPKLQLGTTLVLRGRSVLLPSRYQIGMFAPQPPPTILLYSYW